MRRREGESRRRWRGSLARFLQRESAPSRAAARRADAPHRAATAPRRNAPWVPALRELAGPVVARQVCLSLGERSQVPGRNAAHCPCRPLHRKGLCRPGGPDGEGQARGQARNARGEPPQDLAPIGRIGKLSGSFGTQLILSVKVSAVK
jgi:hypothetical protein